MYEGVVGDALGFFFSGILLRLDFGSKIFCFFRERIRGFFCMAENVKTGCLNCRRSDNIYI